MALNLTARSISFEGRTRTYKIHKPSPPTGIAPQVVIGLHGGNGTGQGFAANFDRFDNTGVWFVFPDAEIHGGEARWVKFGDAAFEPGIDERQDERFVLAIMADVVAFTGSQGITPPEDWYVTGFSSGGAMTHHLYVTQADKFRAFAPQSKALREVMAAMIPPEDKPVLFGCGTLDPSNYNPEPGEHLGAVETAAWFRSRLGCATSYTQLNKVGTKATTQQRTYIGCGIPFRHNNVVNGAHAWFGKKNHGAHTESEVIEFFDVFAGLAL